MDTKTNDNAQAIQDLNELLKLELSAVETYKQALDKLENQSANNTLRGCQQSHSNRASKLRPAISDLGGKPAAAIGLGGQFTKLVMTLSSSR